MADQELKCTRMVKRSQGKSKLGVVNYKERVFVLTSSSLSYFDGNLAVSASADYLHLHTTVADLHGIHFLH